MNNFSFKTIAISLRLLSLTLFAILITSGLCPAVTYTVDDDGPADFTTIQAAINAAWHWDVIQVQPGTYYESIYFNSLAITVTSTNPFDPDIVAATIIYAAGQYAVTFDFMETGDSVLTGFTITNHGILCLAASPTISNNVIQACSDRAIMGQYAAEPDILYNTIQNNTGGGIEGCNGLIASNLITANSGNIPGGGGLLNCDGEISGNTISGNIVDNHGGGLSGCDGEISGNVISNNIARDGGGGLYGCNGTINNNAIYDNTASGNSSTYGGGLAGCNGTISGNTISNNTAIANGTTCGGGLYQCNGTISDNIISNNTSGSTNATAFGGGLYQCDNAISGNTISNNIACSTNSSALGGGLYQCDGEISNNTISHNTTAGTYTYGGGLYECGTIRNNTISGNYAKTAGAGLCQCTSGPITNNTITGNRVQEYGGGLYNCNTTVKNNIIALNQAVFAGGIYGTCSNSYNAFWGNTGGNFGGGSYAKTGDFHMNPLFAVDGSWYDNSTPGDLTDDIWTDGDYHLQAKAGRYTEFGWVLDTVDSPCIDAGNPADNVSNEPQPNGNRINMGTYGGTTQASKTSGTSITSPGAVENLAVQGGHKKLTLSWDEPSDNGGLVIELYKIYRGPAADQLTYLDEVPVGQLTYIDINITNGQTYYYSVTAVNGFGEGPQAIPVSAVAQWNEMDFNEDGIVNLFDFVIFSNEWLWQASWSAP